MQGKGLFCYNIKRCIVSFVVFHKCALIVGLFFISYDALSALNRIIPQAPRDATRLTVPPTPQVTIRKKMGIPLRCILKAAKLFSPSSKIMPTTDEFFDDENIASIASPITTQSSERNQINLAHAAMFLAAESCDWETVQNYLSMLTIEQILSGDGIKNILTIAALTNKYDRTDFDKKITFITKCLQLSPIRSWLTIVPNDFTESDILNKIYSVIDDAIQQYSTPH